MTTATPSRANGHDPARDVLIDAARRMLPVLAGRVISAATDRVVEQVEQLTDRLGDIAENGLPRRQESSPDDDADDGPSRQPVGTAFTFLIEQARRVLDILVRLLATAAVQLRTATERLRNRRAPEGIDEAEDEHDDEHDDEMVETA